MNTKKILLYGGSALLVGAVGFFVWSFFLKVDVPMTEAPMIDDESTNDKNSSSNSSSNPFSSMPTDFEPIKRFNIQSDLDWLMNNVSKN